MVQLTDSEVVLIAYLLMSVYCIASVSTSFLFFNKKWRSTEFPEFNVKLHQMFSFFSRKPAVEKYRVNKGAIVNNRFVLPYFGNMMLKYRVVGDFAEYIQTIKIETMFEKEDSAWMAVFEFSETPVHGFMEIEYL